MTNTTPPPTPPLGPFFILSASPVGSPCIYLLPPIQNPFPMFSYIFPIILSCFHGVLTCLPQCVPLYKTAHAFPTKFTLGALLGFVACTFIPINGFSVHHFFTMSHSVCPFAFAIRIDPAYRTFVHSVPSVFATCSPNASPQNRAFPV